MTKQELVDLIIAFTDDFYRIAKAILKEDADCEDAMSSAIVKGFSKICTLKQKEYAKTWFSRILINECQMILRKRKREVAYEERVLTEEAAQLDYSDLYQNLMQLDISYRLPLVMYYFDGFKIREIADILEMSESAIKMRLNRGKIQLRTMFEKEAAI